MPQPFSFTVADIHRRAKDRVTVVGIQSTEGKIYPAAHSVAKVFADASVRELSRFLDQMANVDGRGQVVSFTETMKPEVVIPPAPLDLAALEIRDVPRERARDRAPEGERITCDDLGLTITLPGETRP